MSLVSVRWTFHIQVLICTAGIVLSMASSSVHSQAFTCPIGKDAACLDYGSKVCSSLSKCVSYDAICFSKYTCDYNGFICKSKFDDAIDDLESNIFDYNYLVEKHNSLLEESVDLKIALENMEYERDHLADAIDEIKACLADATDIESAHACS